MRQGPNIRTVVGSELVRSNYMQRRAPTGTREELEQILKEKESKLRETRSLFPLIPYDTVTRAIRNLNIRLQGSGLEALLSTRNEITLFNRDLPIIKTLGNFEGQYKFVILPRSDHAKDFLEHVYKAVRKHGSRPEHIITAEDQPAEGFYLVHEKPFCFNNGIIPVKKIEEGGEALLFIGWDHEKQESGVYNFVRQLYDANGKPIDEVAHFRNKANILYQLRHYDNILPIKTVGIEKWSDPEKIARYFNIDKNPFNPEYYCETVHCEGTMFDLIEWLAKIDRIGEASTRFDHGFTKALLAMHKEDFIHRDANLFNFLVRLIDVEDKGFDVEIVACDTGISLPYHASRVTIDYTGSPDCMEPEGPLVRTYANRCMKKREVEDREIITDDDQTNERKYESGWLEDEAEIDTYNNGRARTAVLSTEPKIKLGDIKIGKETELTVEEIINEDVSIARSGSWAVVTNGDNLLYPLDDLAPTLKDEEFTTDHLAYIKAVGIITRQSDDNLYVYYPDYAKLAKQILVDNSVEALQMMTQAHQDELAFARLLNNLGHPVWAYGNVEGYLRPRVDRTLLENVSYAKKGQVINKDGREIIIHETIPIYDPDEEDRVNPKEIDNIKFPTKSEKGFAGKLAAQTTRLYKDLMNTHEQQLVHGRMFWRDNRAIRSHTMPRAISKHLRFKDYLAMNGVTNPATQKPGNDTLFFTDPGSWMTVLAGLLAADDAPTEHVRKYFADHLRVDLEEMSNEYVAGLICDYHFGMQIGLEKELQKMSADVFPTLARYYSMLKNGQIEFEAPGVMTHNGRQITEFADYLIDLHQEAHEMVVYDTAIKGIEPPTLAGIYGNMTLHRTHPNRTHLTKKVIDEMEALTKILT